MLRSSLSKLAHFWIFATITACAGADEDLDDDLSGEVSQEIVKGRISDPDQDDVVRVQITDRRDRRQWSCTGALVRDNVLLTARHCTSPRANKHVRCTERGSHSSTQPFGHDVNPEDLHVFIGNSRSQSRPNDARGARFFFPSNNDFCGGDLVYVALDRRIPNAKIAKIAHGVRVTEGQSLSFTGWGTTDSAFNPSHRMHRDDGVVHRVGPASGINVLDPARNALLAVGPVAPGTFSHVGESTCSGDSGGPVKNQNNEIVGVVSYGAGECRAAVSQSVFTSVESHEAIFDAAVMSADRLSPKPINPVDDMLPDGFRDVTRDIAGVAVPRRVRGNPPPVVNPVPTPPPNARPVGVATQPPALVPPPRVRPVSVATRRPMVTPVRTPTPPPPVKLVPRTPGVARAPRPPFDPSDWMFPVAPVSARAYWPAPSPNDWIIPVNPVSASVYAPKAPPALPMGIGNAVPEAAPGVTPIGAAYAPPVVPSDEPDDVVAVPGNGGLGTGHGGLAANHTTFTPPAPAMSCSVTHDGSSSSTPLASVAIIGLAVYLASRRRRA